jgi:hypothetical protein
MTVYCTLGSVRNLSLQACAPDALSVYDSDWLRVPIPQASPALRPVLVIDSIVADLPYSTHASDSRFEQWL